MLLVCVLIITGLQCQEKQAYIIYSTNRAEVQKNNVIFLCSGQNVIDDKRISID